MPTVPSYEPRVGSRPVAPGYQSAQGASADAFGASGGRVLERGGQHLLNAGNEAARVALQAQQEDNAREAKNLDIQFSEAIRQIGYGDGTEANPGYYSLRGEAAVAGNKGAAEAIAEARKRLVATARNPRVAELFGTAAATRVEQEMGQIARFTERERRVAHDATAEARIATALSDAAAAYNNPEVAATSRAVISAEVAALAKSNGWSADVQKARLAEANSTMVLGSIKAALAADDLDTAEKLLDANVAGMTGGAKTEAIKLLEQQGLDKAAQALGNEARRLFPGSLDKQVAWIDSVVDGKKQSAAMQYVENRHSIHRRMITEGRADQEYAENRRDKQQSREREEIRWRNYLSDRAQHDVDVAHRNEERERTERLRNARETAEKHIEAGGRYADLPPDVKASLDGTKIAALERRERQLASGEPIATDWEAYSRYNSMTAEQLRSVDLQVARTQLADREFSIVDAAVRAALAGRRDPNDPASPASVFNAAVLKYGLDGDDKVKVRGQFRTMFFEELEKRQKEKGRELSAEEVRATLKDVTDPALINGVLWGTSERQTFKIKVPEDVRKQIIANFPRERMGREPTEWEITRAYVELQKKAREGKTK